MIEIENIAVGIGTSSDKNILKAIKEAVQQAKLNLCQKEIHLAIIFSTISFAQPNTIQIITDALKEVPIIGCSGAAIITNKGILSNGLSIMLLKFPKTASFKTALVEDVSTKTALNSGEELGERLVRGFQNFKRDLGLIFSDGLINDVPNLISGLQEKLGISFPLIGASASDNLQFSKTYIYFNEKICRDAVCGIIFGGKLNFGWGMKHGWKPLGKPRQVTKSHANIIYEIDHSPAVNVYEEYLACNLREIKNELNRISTFYPIGIELQGEEEYLLRNLHSVDTEGALIFQGNVPEGSCIRLMIGNKESCLNATRQALNEAKNGLFGKKIGFAFIFDSISRYVLLGRNANKELEIIKEEIGADTPIMGVYTYGEQAPLKAINYYGKTYLHNQTFTILAMG